MNRFYYIFLIIFFIVSLFGKENFTILTENYPPYNYLDEETNEIKGISTEIVRKLLKRMNHPDNIKVYPWTRAYNLLKTKDNIILFSTSRTPLREDLFKWVGPIISYEVFFFAKKGSNIEINSLEDAKKVESIGTGNNTSGHIFLKKNGFENLDVVANANLNSRKLLAGRIDLWLSGDLSGIYRTKRLGLDPDLLKPVYSLRTEDLYLAFSKSTPDSVINKWQRELDIIKNSKEYKNIVDKYK